ncbi:MAG: peptidase BlaR1, partial [Myxococcales bacterium]|nr:peptidase BlaR1 [Myxococcales bacterium]
GRARPAWQAGVWLVVLVKFALPWGPAMPWSFSDLITSLTANAGEVGTAVPAAVAQAAPVPHAWPAIGWIVLAMIWLTGVAIVLSRAVGAHRRARLAARKAALAPASALALLESLAARLSVRAPLLAVGDDSIGPHVVGVLRPIIVVPPALLGDLELLRATLLHELAHVRRKDALARVVQIWATALLFFWPVVRLAGRRLDLAREAACDAWALEAGELPRPAYARLLVHMAALRSEAPALAMPHALDARVAAVLGPPARARMGWALRTGLALWIVVALGGARTASARGEHQVCKFTPQLAEALFLAHPEADLDGDGVLSRDEACDLQSELRRRVMESQLGPETESGQELKSLLEEPLCCNCDRGEAYSSPEVASCQGADR